MILQTASGSLCRTSKILHSGLSEYFCIATPSFPAAESIRCRRVDIGLLYYHICNVHVRKAERCAG